MSSSASTSPSEGRVVEDSVIEGYVAESPVARGPSSKGMTRHSGASSISGLLLIDKPVGISSASVVSRARKQLGIKRIGHAGTLDPLATGLLVLLVGNATRLASYAESGFKEYEIEILLGGTTTTDDTEGETLTTAPVNCSAEQVMQELALFQGTLHQIPPQVSAIKVNGERAYDRARRGESTELAAREVTIHSIALVEISLPRIRARIQCTKGTYMRSIARDLGEKLGCGGCISSIRRTMSAPFSVGEAVTLENLNTESLVSWTRLFPKAQECLVEEREAQQLLNGNTSILSSGVGPMASGRLRSPEEAGSGLAIYRRGAAAAAPSLSEVPLGLLVFRDGRWTIGVNVVTGG